MKGRLWAFATLLLFFVATAVAQTIPRGVAVPLTTLFPQPGLYSYPFWYLAIAALASPVQITGGTLASGIYKGVEYQFHYFENGGLRYPPISNGSVFVPSDNPNSIVTLPIVQLGRSG